MWLTWGTKENQFTPAIFASEELVKESWRMSYRKVGEVDFRDAPVGIRVEVSMGGKIVGYYRRSPVYNCAQHL